VKILTDLALISLGSNVQPERHLCLAAARLVDIGDVAATSTVYQNPALGRPEQPDYLNAAAVVHTSLPLPEIRRQLRQIEAELGRIRSADKFAMRTIDLDLSFLGEGLIEAPRIRLADPEVLRHAHLAIPLAEVAPDLIHPGSGETLQQIADRLAPSANRLTPRPDIRLAG
jgi:2-amino-4-hydroxy-6-hydroxymethyldihydropteridine diphosphokinase